jgi:hypothetical protein
MTARASLLSATEWTLPFFVRTLGNVQRLFSRSSSDHSIPATSPRRWPESIKSFTIEPNGAADLAGRPPNHPQFIIEQDPVAGGFLCRLLDAGEWGGRNDFMLKAPAKKFADAMNSISHDGRSTLDNLFEHVADIAAGDAG